MTTPQTRNILLLSYFNNILHDRKSANITFLCLLSTNITINSLTFILFVWWYMIVKVAVIATNHLYILNPACFILHTLDEFYQRSFSIILHNITIFENYVESIKSYSNQCYRLAKPEYVFFADETGCNTISLMMAE